MLDKSCDDYGSNSLPESVPIRATAEYQMYDTFGHGWETFRKQVCLMSTKFSA